MSEFDFDTTTVSASALGNSLMRILMSDDIKPGSDLSYQLAKDIYLYHTLGQKMAEAPINVAQSQVRQISVQDAPDEVVEAFNKAAEKLDVNKHVHNLGSLSRVYGLSSIVMGCEGKRPDEPLDMWRLSELPIFFNVLDPLNTAGSLVLTQIPTAADFTKPARVVTNGQEFHRSRYLVMMNENPIYLAYTPTAFGFVGRSVYQRALYPLKSFIRTMIADDMIATKLGLIVAKQEPPGSIIDNLMAMVAGVKRVLLKLAHTNQVISIGTGEDIETLDMQNVDGAGTYSRTNILKNIATAADMPARMLENETMVAGFGEGSEDAKKEAAYIDRIRIWLDPAYRYFDNVTMYYAWNEDLYKRIQAKYSDYKGVDFRDAFSRWRRDFSATWPSMLIEPESEQLKAEEVKLEAAISVIEVTLPHLDPPNQVKLLQTALQNLSENKKLFRYEFELDWESLEAHIADKQKQDAENAKAGAEPAPKTARTDSVTIRRLREATAKLPDKCAPMKRLPRPEVA